MRRLSRWGPHARPELHEVALAAAELNGSPLADHPDLIQYAADKVCSIKPDANGDDVVLYGVDVVVPTAVRVETGWDRGAHGPAAINRLRVRDFSLDTTSANQAAQVLNRVLVSVADAHIADVVTRTPGPHVVVASDVDDIGAIVHLLGANARVVRI